MAEHPNAALAKGLWDAVAAGDSDAIARLMTDEVEWRAWGRNPLSGIHRGTDGVLDYLARIGELADDLVSDLKDVFVSPSGAVILYHVAASRRAMRLSLDFVLVLEIRDGRIASADSFAVDQYRNDEFWKYAAG